MKYYLAPHSAPDSAPYSKIKKVSPSVPSLRTIDHTNIFTQDTFHSSFISNKKIALSMAHVFRNMFLPQMNTSFHS